MTPSLTFVCSICAEASTSICVYCTKDACPNHLCDRCHRCSDCCECDIRLEDHPEFEEHAILFHAEPAAGVAAVATETTLPVNGDGLASATAAGNVPEVAAETVTAAPETGAPAPPEPVQAEPPAVGPVPEPVDGAAPEPAEAQLEPHQPGDAPL